MAAQDDKISENRRRLFKALSAVPVVMTLRPGEAMANMSAFQCLAETRQSPIDPLAGHLGGFKHADDTNLVLRDKKRWTWRCDLLIVEPEIDPEPFPTEGFIVKFGRRYYDHNSEEITAWELSTADSEDGTDKILIFKDANSATLCTIPKGEKRYFPVVGRSNPEETSFNVLGHSYPRKEVEIPLGEATPPGSNQVINGSCLHSMASGSTGLLNLG